MAYAPTVVQIELFFLHNWLAFISRVRVGCTEEARPGWAGQCRPAKQVIFDETSWLQSRPITPFEWLIPSNLRLWRRRSHAVERKPRSKADRTRVCFVNIFHQPIACMCASHGINPCRLERFFTSKMSSLRRPCVTGLVCYGWVIGCCNS